MSTQPAACIINTFPYVFDHGGEDIDEPLDELVVILAQFRHVRFGAGIVALRDVVSTVCVTLRVNCHAK